MLNIIKNIDKYPYKFFEKQQILMINGDCLEVMQDMEEKSVDFVLTDPPYGLNIDGQKKSICKNNKHNRKEFIKKHWDNSIPDKKIFENIFRISNNQIIWGANYFNEYLEQGHKGWIIWDKRQDGLTMSDCEIAYSSFDCPTRIIRINRVELLKDNTVHPTQKPLKLFKTCIANYSKENDLILDCFSGSGTTAIASYNLKRKCICIEKDKNYFDLSVKRCEEYFKQMCFDF